MKTHVHKITADRKALTRTIKNSPLLDEYRKSNWISEFNVWFENYFKEKKRPDWRKASTRKEVLLKLVETGCQGDVKKISRRMLECVEIDSMFSRRHNLTSLLIEAGLVYDQETIKKYSQEGLFENEKAYPWEIEMFMQYNDVDMRKYIHRWTLFKKFGKNVNEISNEEIATLEEKAYCELGIKRIFGKSPKPRNRFELLVEMGVCYSKEDIQAFQKIGDFGDEKIYPWDIKNFEILSDKKMLVAACRQFIQKCKINLSEFVQGHILKNGFGQCIRYLRPNVIYNFLTYADCIYSESESDVLSALKC